MQELKDRIAKEGKVLPGNIIKVDGFLNHRIDTELMEHIAEEFGKYFDMSGVSVILTAEASGIALAAICAYRYNKPLVFAKKAKSDNIEGGLYCSEIVSYTYRKKVTLIVSKEWLHAGDRVADGRGRQVHLLGRGGKGAQLGHGDENLAVCQGHGGTSFLHE